MSAPCAWPGKECQNGSRGASCIAKVEMISARVIEIDRALDQTQPKQSDVESQVPLRVAGDGGDVMKSGDSLLHRYHTVSTSFHLATAFASFVPNSQSWSSKALFSRRCTDEQQRADRADTGNRCSYPHD